MLMKSEVDEFNIHILNYKDNLKPQDFSRPL